MVKMVLASSDTQSSTTSTLMSERMTAYQNTMAAITAFINDTELKGSAYSNAKAYATSVLLPVLKGAALYAEALSGGMSRLPGDYRKDPDLGEEDLDSVVLTEELTSLDMSISSLKASIKSAKSGSDNKKALQGQLSDAETRRDKVVKQLAALATYDSNSAGFFDDLTALESNLTTGLSAISSAMANFNGSFSIPSKDQLAWARSVTTQWNQRQAVLEKLSNGEELDDEDVKAIETYLGAEVSKTKEILVYDDLYGYAKYSISVNVSRDGEVSLSVEDGEFNGITAGNVSVDKDGGVNASADNGFMTGSLPSSGVGLGTSAIGTFGLTYSYDNKQGGKTTKEIGQKFVNHSLATYQKVSHTAEVKQGKNGGSMSVVYEQGRYIRPDVDPVNVQAVDWGTVGKAVGIGVGVGVAVIAAVAVAPLVWGAIATIGGLKLATTGIALASALFAFLTGDDNNKER